MKKVLIKYKKVFVLFKPFLTVLILAAMVTGVLIGGTPVKAASNDYVSPIYNFPDTNGGNYVFGTYGSAWGGYHLAIDMRRPVDTPVCAVLEGTVVSCGYMQGFGDKNGPGGAAIIEHKNNYGETFYALYGHLKDLEITPGQTVIKGQLIGRVMNLVNDYGVANPHLHFGINRLRPSYAGYTSEANSEGFVDPFVYLEHTCRESFAGHTYRINGQKCEVCGVYNPSYDQSKPTGIEINGYQISASVGGQQGVGGMRVVYSCEDTINDKKVVGSGLIYAIDELSQKNQMFVGSTDQYVHSFESSTFGIMPEVVSKSFRAMSLAMTMKFVNQVSLEYTVTYNVRAYAKLQDGTYVYSDICQYRIYDVAEQLYKTGGMSTEAGHNYLYENILYRVNKEYTRIDYLTNKTITF